MHAPRDAALESAGRDGEEFLGSRWLILTDEGQIHQGELDQRNDDQDSDFEHHRCRIAGHEHLMGDVKLTQHDDGNADKPCQQSVSSYGLIHGGNSVDSHRLIWTSRPFDSFDPG